MLTGLELTFMGVTRSNLVFSALQVLLSYVWEKEKKKGRREGGEKGIEKEWKEGKKAGRRNKKVKDGRKKE